MVKTTCAMTETAEVGDCLGQGTAGAGVVSQDNLDHGLNSYFPGCKDVMYYGETIIHPLGYQDDLGAPCLNVRMARVQASLLASLIQEKTLLAQPDKNGYLVLGEHKSREGLRKELKDNQIDFRKFTLKDKEND